MHPSLNSCDEGVEDITEEIGSSEVVFSNHLGVTGPWDYSFLQIPKFDLKFIINGFKMMNGLY